jgi:hypothetical protein
MGLASPKLKLPNSREQVAFRAVEQLLKSDPLLSVTVKAWRSWKGEQEDIAPPTFSTCPYVRLTPLPEVSERRTEIEHMMPLDIQIVIAVAGSDFDQLTNFWGAIRSAVYPTVEPRRTLALDMSNDATITRSQMTMNAIAVKVEDQGLRMIVAKGTLQIILLIRTM